MMPTDELIACAIVGAIAAAVLMNCAVREHRRLKRAGNVNAATFALTPSYVGLSLFAACLGGVDWDTQRQLSEQAIGAVIFGMLIGAVTADLRGLGLGGDGDAQDGDGGGDDGGDGGGE